MRTLFERLTFLAVPLGLYQAAAVAAMLQVSGVNAGTRAAWLALGYAFAAGMGVYLLDRVKLRDAWLDPADAVAHPARAEFIARHARGVRMLMALVLVVGGGLGAAVSWWLVPLLVGACAGVVAYAGMPRGARARPKDVLLLKNACVAAAMTVFVGIVAWHAAGSAREAGDHIAAAAGLANVFVRVLCDAVLCDLDDEHADRAFATATLATKLGRGWAWAIAGGGRLVLGAGLVVAGRWVLAGRAATAATAWGGVTIASTLLTRAVKPATLRDWVDWRFALEAALVAAWMVVARP